METLESTIDRRTIASVLKQIMDRILKSDCYFTAEFQQYLESELETLSEILNSEEIKELEFYISNIFLLIRNHEK
jgi:hypothetical protein